MLALRRRYPQIYTTSEKLQLDVSSINLAAKDFFNAMNTIVPASQRSVTSPARALSMRVQPLLRNIFKQCIDAVQKVFPSVFSQLSCLDAPGKYSLNAVLSKTSQLGYILLYQLRIGSQLFTDYHVYVKYNACLIRLRETFSNCVKQIKGLYYQVSVLEPSFFSCRLDFQLLFPTKKKNESWLQAVYKFSLYNSLF